MTKTYRISFSFAIGENDYSDIIRFNVGSDRVPQGKNPVEFLKERIAAEIKRTTKDVEFEDGVL